MAVRIESCDPSPDLESGVANVSFVDPKEPTSVYCIGFKFFGGELRKPENWRIDHCNYWTPELMNDDNVLENPVSHDQVEEALKKYEDSFNGLLKKYLEKF